MCVYYACLNGSSRADLSRPQACLPPGVVSCFFLLFYLFKNSKRWRSGPLIERVSLAVSVLCD
uniref:Uncharacterized protein n=2 Tax=Anguilla anguilla TaxID=7936 RepID=A0A0E9RTY8_ANGAN